MQYKILILFISLILSVGSTISVSHAAPVGLKIQPVKVSYTLEPGEALRDIILLSNPNDSPVFVTTSVEDFVPARGGTGISFVGRAEGVTTVRDWITQDFTDFRLEGNSEKEMPFTIRVPRDAEPGGHYGLLFFRASASDEAGGQLKVGTRVGVLVFVTVPGDFVQSGTLHSFTGPRFVQKGPVTFRLDLENTGTVHFEPEGIIRITNLLGKEVGLISVQGQVVLPTGQREILASWPTKRLFFGIYKAQAEIQDGEGNVLASDIHRFIGFPIVYILGLFIVLVILYFGFKFARRKLNISISVKK